MADTRKQAEAFADHIVDLILLFGGKKSTALNCAAVWWEAIERGEFGEVTNG